MKYCVKGDPHNNIKDFYSELEKTESEFCLCTGDFGFYPDLNIIKIVDRKAWDKSEILGYGLQQFDPAVVPKITIYSVPGNHEDQEYLDDAYVDGVIQFNKNLTVVHGAILQIKPNLFIAGIGKIFVENTLRNYTTEFINSMGTRRGRKPNLGYIKRRNHITMLELTNFLDKIRIFSRTRTKNDRVIWLSHDAPRHIDPKRKIPVGSDYVRQLIDLVGPDISFFGHYHYDYEFPGSEPAHIIQKYTLKEFEL